jgi:hypothetical protein
VLAAWAYVETQLRVSAMGNIIGIDYAAAAVSLKSSGFWDDEQDCVPADLLRGLRIVEAELISRKLCPECSREAIGEKRCSKCGRVFSDDELSMAAGRKRRGLLEG